jgi:toxin-antitoxin system PIN domain toxin
VIVPDANLLLYAYDSRSPFHAAARTWWETCLTGSEAVGFAHPVLFAFVRIGMSPRAFESPMTLEQVTRHVTTWLDRRVTRVLQPPLDYLPRTLELLRAAGAAGPNLVTDAQVAAIASFHKATVHTADRDFARFRGLECRFPLDA